MLKKRLITALWGIPLVIAAVWFDEPLPWFTILAVIVGVLAILEFYRLVGVTGVIPLTACGLVLALLFIIFPHFDFGVSASEISLLFTAAVALPMILMIFIPQKEGLFRLWAWTLTGVLYIGWLLSYFVALRIEAGRNWLLLALFITFASDTAAYFIGKAVGKHKLAPSISPGKTWEGAFAGVIGAVIVGYIFTLHTPFQTPMNFFHAVALAVAVSVFGQLGDLAESMLKRGAGVKDSGKLMPGHGGILDRLDSLLFSGFVVYIFFKFVISS